MHMRRAVKIADMYGGDIVHMNVTDTKLNRLTDRFTDTDEI